MGYSQTTNATLSGVVEDPNGSPVPGVKVTVINPATGMRRTVTTDESGNYVVPLLPPAKYSVQAEATGFKRVQFPDVVLNVNDRLSFRIQLEVGDVAGVVEVRPNDFSAVRMDGGVSTTIPGEIAGNMPLNGRSFSSLVLLTPGVTITGTGSNGGFGQFSVNGQRASTNYFTVDGVSANIGMPVTAGTQDQTGTAGGYPGQGATGRTSNLVSQDALQEFKIQTSSYTADSGRQPGAQVQVITKGGGNTYHGSAFDYLRNEAFDARNFFNKEPAVQTKVRQNIFGGTFSGPLPFLRFGDGSKGLFTSGKDRTFFFFSYEGQRLRLPITGTSTVPSLRLRSIAHTSVQPILNAFPKPNGDETTVACTQPAPPLPPDPTCGSNNRRLSGFAPFSYSLSNPSEQDETSVRIDHAVNGKHSVFGRFNEAPSRVSTLSGAAYSQTITASTRTFTTGLTSVLSTKMSNELRFNYSKQSGFSESTFATLGGAVPLDLSLLTNGFPGLGTVQFSFGSGLPIVTITGGESTKNLQRQINVVDNFTWIKGGHQFKFGVDYRRLSPTIAPQDQQNVVFSNENGVVSARLGSASVSRSDAARLRFTNFSAYAQDTWKANHRLTLDLGLRWELNPAPTEVDGKMPAVVRGINGVTDFSGAVLAPAGTEFYKTFWTAFAPRLGAAYLLNTKPGKETVVRGGFGVYYDLGGSGNNGLPPGLLRTFPSSICPAPIAFPLNATCAARVPIAVPTTTPVAVTVSAINENLKLPYSLHWNAAVEQSLGKSSVVTLSYVASAGRELLTAVQLNGLVNGARPNSNFSTINYAENGPSSDYHSLQAQYRARFKRFNAVVNYTWSHAIDEISSDVAFSALLERGNADFDIRHNFSGALHYDIPTLQMGRIAEAVLGGWSLDGIVHIQSGRPIEIAGITTIDGRLVSQRPNYNFGQPLYIDDPSVPGGRRFNSAAFSNPGAGRQGSFGRNVLRGLPIYQLDLSLGRTITLRERLKLQLKGDVFNVLNHPMFGYGGTTTAFAVSDLFGVPTQTLNSTLGGLNALYQMGGPRSIQLLAKLLF
jgi:hypothetical protein